MMSELSAVPKDAKDFIAPGNEANAQVIPASPEEVDVPIESTPQGEVIEGNTAMPQPVGEEAMEAPAANAGQGLDAKVPQAPSPSGDAPEIGKGAVQDFVKDPLQTISGEDFITPKG